MVAKAQLAQRLRFAEAQQRDHASQRREHGVREATAPIVG
jgi:hypothetical protein